MATVSIVTPVYFNELNLPDTIPELLALRESFAPDALELVFVDDGSGDRALEILLEFRARYPDVIRVVKLTRNFGSMSAIQAGLRVATGDCVAMVAADLQDPPELLVQMTEHWRRGQKAVFAVRADREEPWSQKLFSNTFYALVRRFALRAYPPGGFDLFLIDRQVVDEVNRIDEKNVNILALIFWLGYENVQIPYVRRARRKGKSRWTMSKKIKLVVDSFVAFSYAPIRALSLVGFGVAASAFLYAIFVAYERLVNHIPVQGFATIVILIAMASGIQMAMLGVLGEYLWRALDETRRRPGYVVDAVFAAPRESALPRGAARGTERGA